MTKPLLLINPNTSEVSTREMVRIARESAPYGPVVESITARQGASLIDDDEKLAIGARVVLDMARTLDLTKYGGVVISAFGDPAREALRRHSPVPVTGIAEAGILEAAGNGRRFSIVTTTPRLVSAIEERVVRYGQRELCAGVRLAEGDAVGLMDDPARLEASLARACEMSIQKDDTEAIIIGGGPLAACAASLRRRFAVPIIEPVPAAMRLAALRADETGSG